MKNRFSIYLILTAAAFTLLWYAKFPVKDFAVNLSASLIAVILIYEIYERGTEIIKANRRVLVKNYALEDLHVTFKDIFFALRGTLDFHSSLRQPDDYIDKSKITSALKKTQPLGFFVLRFWGHYLRQIEVTLDKRLVIEVLSDKEITSLVNISETLREVIKLLDPPSLTKLEKRSGYKITPLQSVAIQPIIAGYTGVGFGTLQSISLSKISPFFALGVGSFFESQVSNVENEYSIDAKVVTPLASAIATLFKELQDWQEILGASRVYPELYIDVIGYS